MASAAELADPDAHIVERDGVKYAVPTLHDYRRYRAMTRPDPDLWHLAHDDKKAIKVYTRMAQPGEPGAGLVMALVVSRYPDVPVESLWACLQDNDYRLVWDKNQIEGHLITTLAEGRSVLWYYACKFPVVANRDFVSQSSCCEFANGDRMTVSRAAEHPSEPPKPPFVRAESVMTINYIERLDPDSDVGCQLSYLSHCDLKGNIPKFLLNRATASLLPNVMRSLGDTARGYEKYAEENHPPGHVPPWKTLELDWDATDGDIRRQRDEPALLSQVQRAGQVLATSLLANGVVTDTGSENAPTADAANAADSNAGKFERVMAEVLAFADAWFVEARRVPTREEYLTFVHAAVRSHLGCVADHCTLAPP